MRRATLAAMCNMKWTNTKQHHTHQTAPPFTIRPRVSSVSVESWPNEYVHIKFAIYYTVLYATLHANIMLCVTWARHESSTRRELHVQWNHHYNKRCTQFHSSSNAVMLRVKYWPTWASVSDAEYFSKYFSIWGFLLMRPIANEQRRNALHSRDDCICFLYILYINQIW